MHKPMIKIIPYKHYATEMPMKYHGQHIVPADNLLHCCFLIQFVTDSTIGFRLMNLFLFFFLNCFQIR